MGSSFGKSSLQITTHRPHLWPGGKLTLKPKIWFPKKVEAARHQRAAGAVGREDQRQLDASCVHKDVHCVPDKSVHLRLSPEDLWDSDVAGTMWSTCSLEFWRAKNASLLVSFMGKADCMINPLHIVWGYIVMLISCDFQNIVEISLSHFFLTISHDIYLISTHTESPYRWLKVPIGEAIFWWKWHKMSKYTPYKWSLTGKDRFPKKL